MNLTDVEKMAYDLMREHGLLHRDWRTLPWTFGWDNSKKRLGRCRFPSREIRVSRPYAELNDVEKVRDTILHEIAHALVGSGMGHGRVWKLKARELGAVPETCSNVTSLVMPAGRYQAVCQCASPHHMHRKPRNKYRCRICRQTLTFLEVSR